MADIKDEVTQQLGLALGRDSGVPEGWAKIVAVVRIAPGTFGGWSKAYMADDTPVNFHTEDEPFPKYAKQLNDLMIQKSGIPHYRSSCVRRIEERRYDPR